MRARVVVEAGYVVAVGSLAVCGAFSQHPQYYLAAVLLALPLGLVALVSVYGGYALIQAVGGLFAPSTTADGSQARWLAVASSSFTITALTLAALANALVLRRLSRRAGSRLEPPRGSS